MVYFVGAGSGAKDLITVRGANLLGKADVVIYAGSLVNEEILEYATNTAEIFNSAYMSLEDVLKVVQKAEGEGKTTVRLHTGDPSIYGAIQEQMQELDNLGIEYAVCPGVSSFCGAASSLNLEYTQPGVSQSVIITRLEGRTPMPPREQIELFAAHRTTMVIFLSAGMLGTLAEKLMTGGYPGETPAAIVYKATWKDEKRIFCQLQTLEKRGLEENINKTALIIVGAVLHKQFDRSLLYHPNFTTEFRRGLE